MMENFETNDLTNDVESLAKLNEFNRNYTSYSRDTLNMKAISEDFELLKQYTQRYQSRYASDQPCIGDCLHLPDGQTVYFCDIHDTYAQTCGWGAFCLTTHGYLTCSANFDRGINFYEIQLTTELDMLPIWFSHRGYRCAGCEILARIQCRVWKPIEGADLTGIPQIRSLKRKKLKEQSETLTKVDRHCKTYLEHLPEIIIDKYNVSVELLNEVEQATELKFEDSYHFVPVYWCQPMTLKQIQTLRNFVQFEISEENHFSTNLPLLILRMKE